MLRSSTKSSLSPFAGITLVAGLLFSSPRLAGVTVTPEELNERRDWVAARFEGRQPPPRTDPALGHYSTEPPFSFVCGGQAFSGFLSRWKLERNSRQIDAQRIERQMLWADAETGL